MAEKQDRFGSLLRTMVGMKAIDERSRQFDEMLPLQEQQLAQGEEGLRQGNAQLLPLLESHAQQKQINELKRRLANLDPKRSAMEAAKSFELRRILETIQGNAPLPPATSMGMTLGEFGTPEHVSLSARIETGISPTGAQAASQALKNEQAGAAIIAQYRQLFPGAYDLKDALDQRSPSGINLRKLVEITGEHESLSNFEVSLRLLGASAVLRGQDVQIRGQDVQLLIAQLQGNDRIQAAFASTSGERAKALVALFKAAPEGANAIMAHMEKVGELIPELRAPMGDAVVNYLQAGMDMIGYGTQLEPGTSGLFNLDTPGGLQTPGSPAPDWQQRGLQLIMGLQEQGVPRDQAVQQGYAQLQQEMAGYQPNTPPLVDVFRSLAGAGGVQGGTGGAGGTGAFAPDPNVEFPQSQQPQQQPLLDLQGGHEPTYSPAVRKALDPKAPPTPNKVAGEDNYYAVKWDDWFLNTAVPLLKLPPTMVEEYLGWNTNQRMSFAQQFAKDRSEDLQKAAIGTQN